MTAAKGERLCQVCRAHFNLSNRFSARSLIFLLLFNVLKNKTKIDLGLIETAESFTNQTRHPKVWLSIKVALQSREKERERRTVSEILMLSGIFSAVRIWSERAVTTLLHLTLAIADMGTGCPINRCQRRDGQEVVDGSTFPLPPWPCG